MWKMRLTRTLECDCPPLSKDDSKRVCLHFLVIGIEQREHVHGTLTLQKPLILFFIEKLNLLRKLKLIFICGIENEYFEFECVRIVVVQIGGTLVGVGDAIDLGDVPPRLDP